MKYLIQKLFAAFFIFCALDSSAATFPVQINPGEYTGSWNIGGPWRSGSAQLNLSAGQHLCYIGEWDTITIRVEANGSVLIYDGVTFATSSASAVAVGSTLQFLTKPVVIDPQSYTGSWNLSQVSPWLQGVKNQTLVPGLKYRCLVGQADGIIFKVQANGDLLVYDGGGFATSSASATASGNTLQFLNTQVAIDPKAYAGSWNILQVSPWLQGTNTLMLVPGLNYKCQVGFADGILVKVEEDGNLLVYDGVGFAASSISALANGSNLEFRVAPVVIDPGSYSGTWNLLYSTPNLTGKATVQLVPGLVYHIQPFQGTVGYFKVLADCNFLPEQVQTPTATFTLSCPLMGETINLQQATATFSQTAGAPFEHLVSRLIDGVTEGSPGWAIYPQTGQAQTAVFESVSDLGFAGGSRFTFTLIHNHENTPFHTLGRFRLSITRDHRSLFADGLPEGGDVGADWIILSPDSYTSQNGATLLKLADNSIRVGGALPSTDIYTVSAQTDLTGITGIRLEALPDETLPYSGPGRQPQNGNFVLTEFQAKIIPEATASPVVHLQQATATFSQTAVAPNEHLVGRLIDGVTEGYPGWAIYPQTGQPQTAVFESLNDLGFAGGSRFTFTLIQNHENTPFHTLGRFRLSITRDHRSLFADGLSQGGDVGADWIVLSPDSYTSQNGATLVKLADNSIRVGGTLPSTDIYTISAQTDLTGITGIRLEALPDETLPYSGPGRQPQNGNFVLTEFQVGISPKAAGEPSVFRISSINPESVGANSGDLELTIYGSGFVEGTTNLWNGQQLVESSRTDTEIHLTVPASFFQTSADIRTASIQVRSPTGELSNSKAFTILSNANNVSAVMSAIATSGETVTVSIAPASNIDSGVAATLTHEGEEPASVTVALYNEDPSATGASFDVAGSFLDINVSGANSSDSMIAYFYYPQGASGLTLKFFNNGLWEDVSPFLDDPANRRFEVRFDSNSHPKITELTGTIFAAALPDQIPPAIACPNIILPCSVEELISVNYSAPTTLTDNIDSPSQITLTYSIPSGSGFKVGNTTVTCTATDASGNSSTTTFTVTRQSLGFEGFLSPIGGADASGGSFSAPVRTFKSGSTVPVKFTAHCGGSPILIGIHHLQAVKYSDATTSGDPIDATPRDAATTGNQFRLNGDQWHFNLDTKATGLTSGIWQLVATLSDGSQHRVWIQLK